ncbi:MAG: hypothetical protein Q3988_04080 [Gemella sp.]|nr:hypothetical protein [Gemella sp.]
MKKFLEFIVRLAVLVILFYSSGDSSIIQWIIGWVGITIGVVIPFLVKFRDDEYLIGNYSNIKYLHPLENIMLVVIFIILAFQGVKLEIVFLGIFLIAILQIFDSIFLKNLKRKLHN